MSFGICWWLLAILGIESAASRRERMPRESAGRCGFTLWFLAQRFRVRGGESVDFGTGALFRHGDQNAVGELWVPALERDPTVISQPADVGEHLLRVASAADHELHEKRAGKRQR